MKRRTRIVATVGPATDRPDVVDALLQIGVDVFRINFSHGNSEDHLRRVAFLRERIRHTSRPIAFLGDLPGPKLRVIIDRSINFDVGQEVELARREGVSATLRVTEPEALAHIQPDQRVLLDDGRLQMRVVRVEADRVTLRVDDGGELLPNKGINLPDTQIALPAVTERDLAALKTAATAGVDWLALSFVRSAFAAEELRHAARQHGLHVPILAKIEKPDALRDAEAIIAAFDAIMVARGDLGVEIDLAEVPQVQKRLIRLARAAGKPVITATDMLDSMRQNPRPTRAEVSDVANAVYDGTDAVMLSGETSIGQFPVAATETMDRVVRAAEHQLAEIGYGVVSFHAETHDRITSSACRLAHELHADAIIAPTVSGRTARMMARHRPAMRIVAPATDESIIRELSLAWGVTAVPMGGPLKAGDDRLEAAVRAAFDSGAVKAGERAVLIGGHPIEGGPSIPTIRVVQIGAEGRSCAAEY